jgi:SAM-dependent methyltransferase
MTSPTPALRCRACATALQRTFVDLGATPLANSYVDPSRAHEPDQWYPLHVRICEQCLLVQLPEVVPADAIFSDYAYFSSYSTSWLEHARRYAEQSIKRWDLGTDSQVVEVASNDGYLLTNFVEAGVPVLGIEPAANVAAAAQERGVRTEVCFLGASTGASLAAAGARADLLVANNVLAHVPDINDFVAGLASLLAPQGVLSVEFPHLLNLIEQVQFDTIYHEHFSYLSLHTATTVLARHGLRVFDVEQLPTHGGSLRLLACHVDADHLPGDGLASVRSLEQKAGLDTLEGHDGFAGRVRRTQEALLSFLDSARDEGRTVVAYGAAAKGNTLLNSSRIGTERIAFVVDRSPYKQGRLLPGSRLPIRAPEDVAEVRPDHLLILPWNLADEVIEQMAHVREWGATFVIPVPEVAIRT